MSKPKLKRSKPAFEICGEEWSNAERYALAESAFAFWNSEEDDHLFDESVSL